MQGVDPPQGVELDELLVASDIPAESLPSPLNSSYHIIHRGMTQIGIAAVFSMKSSTAARASFETCPAGTDEPTHAPRRPARVVGILEQRQ